MTNLDSAAAVPIGLMLLLVFGVWLGIAGPLFTDLDTRGPYYVLREWQTALVGIPAVIVASIGAVNAWRSVQRQLAQQRRATTLNVATREEDRIERLLPGLERAARFLLILSIELRTLTHLEFSMHTLRLHGLLRPESDTEKDVEELLPTTVQAIRDRVIAGLNLLRFRAEQVAAAHSELKDAELKVATIAEWDPAEHAAIRAAPIAVRQKIAEAERRLREAMTELESLERELRDQATSFRRRLPRLRRQIDEALDDS